MKTLYLLVRPQIHKPKGLTLTEVMISMLISGLSLSTAMQAYVSAVGFSAKSQKSDVAIASIKADAETIRQWANERPVAPADCQLRPPMPGGYAQKLMVRVVNQDKVTLGRFDYPSPDWGVKEIEHDPDQETVSQSSILPIPALPSTFEIHRSMVAQTSDLVDPPNVLQVTYEVVDTSQRRDEEEDKPIVQFHTAVMPNAALDCS